MSRAALAAIVSLVVQAEDVEDKMATSSSSVDRMSPAGRGPSNSITSMSLLPLVGVSDVIHDVEPDAASALLNGSSIRFCWTGFVFTESESVVVEEEEGEASSVAETAWLQELNSSASIDFIVYEMF